MNDIIGKKAKNKNDSSIKTIIDVKDEWVWFSDNGRIPLSTFYDRFDILIQENIEKPYIQIYTENKVNKMNDDVINPDAFFAMGAETTRQIYNNPIDASAVKTGNIPPQSMDITDYGTDYSKLNPDTLRAVEADMVRQKQQQQGKIQEIEASIVEKHNDPFFANSFENINEVRVVDRDRDAALLESVRNMASKPINPNIKPNIQQPNQPVYQETSKKVMKKSLKVKLKLEFDEMIPKIETLRALEDLYETSIIEELAKEIVDRYIINRDLLEGMFIAELERIVNPKKIKKKPIKKVVKKPVVKKPNADENK